MNPSSDTESEHENGIERLRDDLSKSTMASSDQDQWQVLGGIVNDHVNVIAPFRYEISDSDSSQEIDCIDLYVSDSDSEPNVTEELRGVVSGMAASQSRLGRRDPEVTLVNRSMAEAADNLSLLELDESVGQEDIVGVSFEDTFLPLSTLAGQTTGS